MMIAVVQATRRWIPPKPSAAGFTCHKANGSCLDIFWGAQSTHPAGRRAGKGPYMTQDYLIGELSVRLGQLQANATHDTAAEIAALRRQIEAGPAQGLRAAAQQALALGDRLCWQSVCRGDMAAFSQQAETLAELRLFGVCSRLLADG